jgi:ribonucleotide reductase alpha subunit
MHMKAYATSAELAKELGPFKGYEKNREHMLRVLRNHGVLPIMPKRMSMKDLPLNRWE